LIKPGDDKSPKCPSIALITTFKVNVDTIDAKNYIEKDTQTFVLSNHSD